MSLRRLLSAISIFIFAPSVANACACGCGVFDVGTGTMMPTGQGGEAWIEWDHMDQNKNWSGTRSSDGANNNDKEIVSNFFVAGAQYMFSRSWGIETEIPFTFRTFNTTDEGTGGPASFNHGALGDIRLKGIYSGFSEDMSTGVTFGLKLPTGDHLYHGFDRDTSIGTGTTDAILGAYHQGILWSAAKLDWFINAQWEHALDAMDDYRPGDEGDGALGAYYNAGPMLGADNLAPVLQLIDSVRMRDSGVNSDRDNSGYARFLLSPGLEYDVDNIRIYGDIELPIYQNVNGNQLVAPVYTKFVVGYNF